MSELAFDDWDDRADEPASPYCTCDFVPTISEWNEGSCFCCGKPLFDRGE